MLGGVVPMLAGAGALKIGAQLGTQNGRMLTAGSGVLSAAASLPNAHAGAAFGGAGGLAVDASWLRFCQPRSSLSAGGSLTWGAVRSAAVRELRGRVKKCHLPVERHVPLRAPALRSIIEAFSK